MTREEAIYFANCLKNNYTIDLNDIQDFCDEAIKALEQESVLDKLKAEIDKIYEREGSSFDCLNALDELKEFIDKYKAESEEQI